MLARTREALIKARADVNAENAKGLTPMDLANKASSWAVYKILEEAGGHLEAIDEQDLRVATGLVLTTGRSTPRHLGNATENALARADVSEC